MPFDEVTKLDTALKRKVARLTVHMDKCQRMMGGLKEQQSAVEMTLRLLNEGAHVEVEDPAVSVATEVERASVSAVPSPGIGPTNAAMELRPSIQEMQAAYDAAPARFTIREIISGLDPKFAESDLARSMASNLLRRKEEALEVYVAERGQGRRPSLYLKRSEPPVATTNGYDVDPDDEPSRQYVEPPELNPQ